MWNDDEILYDNVPTKALLAGDADDDGVVNMNDYLAIIQHTVGNPSLNEDGLLAADVTCDFSVGADDALDVADYVSGDYRSFY